MAILSGGGVLQFITTTYGKFFTVSFPFSSTLTAIFARLRCEIEFVFLVSGGMLGAMWLPFKLGVGGVLGNGNCIIFNARKKNKEIFPKLEIQEINIYLGYLLVIFVEHLSTF